MDDGVQEDREVAEECEVTVLWEVWFGAGVWVLAGILMIPHYHPLLNCTPRFLRPHTQHTAHRAQHTTYAAHRNLPPRLRSQTPHNTSATHHFTTTLGRTGIHTPLHAVALLDRSTRASGVHAWRIRPSSD